MELNDEMTCSVLQFIQEEAKNGGGVIFDADELKARHESLSAYDVQELTDCIDECMSRNFFDMNGNGKNVLGQYAFNGLSRHGRAFLREHE